MNVTIERLLPGGVGLAHADGLTLFVSLAAPGDEVRVKVDRIQGKVAFASIQEILKPSPVRVEPPCPYFGRCGGCDFQQLTYEGQLQAKVDIIQDCFQRIAKIGEAVDIKIHRSPEWQYRARALWQTDAERKWLGYYVRGSREVCDVEYCGVLVPELQKTLESLRSAIETASSVRDIAAVAGDEGVSVDPPLAGLEAREITRTIAREGYHFSAKSFFQINHQLLPALIQDAIGDERGHTAIDLYCGVGLFTIPLARRFSNVIGVEGNERATRFAKKNLVSAGLNNVQVSTADVGNWLANYEAAGKPDLLLLDPPRTGAENKVISGLLALQPSRIVYVSCDPATLARDLKKLLAGGYSLDTVNAFDMFPQTHHVETVVRLLAA
ncbi:MAG TPA: class I SAM-dependent RNA methyltransferase [Pyrinomonadaceae bacterium]|nr:class I SAM-dependent RNA methyltransferase [Pyrinomonadaceae bacterium]